MDMELTAALPSLRDIDGVLASFVVSDEGDVVARDLSAFVEDATLHEVAPRLGRFHEAMSSTGDFLDFFVLEFAHQSLHSRRVPNGFLCLLTTSQVNSAALRMAVNLMARKVGDRIAHQRHIQHALAPTPPPVLTSAARPTPPPLPPAAAARATPAQPATARSRVTPTSTVAVPTPPTRTGMSAPVPQPQAAAPARPLRVYRGTVQRG